MNTADADLAQGPGLFHPQLGQVSDRPARVRGSWSRATPTCSPAARPGRPGHRRLRAPPYGPKTTSSCFGRLHRRDRAHLPDAQTRPQQAAEPGSPSWSPPPSVAVAAHMLDHASQPRPGPSTWGGTAARPSRELIDAAQPLVRWWLDWSWPVFDLSLPRAIPSHPGMVAADDPAPPTSPSSAPRLRPLGEYYASAFQRLQARVPGPHQPAAAGRRQVEVQAPPPLPPPPAPGRVPALKFALRRRDSTPRRPTLGTDSFSTQDLARLHRPCARPQARASPLEAVPEATATQSRAPASCMAWPSSVRGPGDQGYAEPVVPAAGGAPLTHVIDQLSGHSSAIEAQVDRPARVPLKFFEELHRPSRRDSEPCGRGRRSATCPSALPGSASALPPSGAYRNEEGTLSRSPSPRRGSTRFTTLSPRQGARLPRRSAGGHQGPHPGGASRPGS